MTNAVALGYPGETAEDKEKGLAYPQIVEESIQVFECTVNETRFSG